MNMLDLSGDGKYEIVWESTEQIEEDDEYLDVSNSGQGWKPCRDTAFVGRLAGANGAGASGFMFRRLREGCCKYPECFPDSPCWECNERMCQGWYG